MYKIKFKILKKVLKFDFRISIILLGKQALYLKKKMQGMNKTKIIWRILSKKTSIIKTKFSIFNGNFGRRKVEFPLGTKSPNFYTD